MIHTSRQLKALVRNMSKGDSTRAQIIIRNYVMETVRCYKVIDGGNRKRPCGVQPRSLFCVPHLYGRFFDAVTDTRPMLTTPGVKFKIIARWSRNVKKIFA